MLTNALLGTKLKLVRGYKSSAAALLAIERGEAEGIAGNALGFLKFVAADNLREKRLRVIGSFGLHPTEELAGVPLMIDHAKTAPQVCSHRHDRRQSRTSVAVLPAACAGVLQ